MKEDDIQCACYLLWPVKESLTALLWAVPGGIILANGIDMLTGTTVCGLKLTARPVQSEEVVAALLESDRPMTWPFSVDQIPTSRA